MLLQAANHHHSGAIGQHRPRGVGHARHGRPEQWGDPIAHGQRGKVLPLLIGQRLQQLIVVAAPMLAQRGQEGRIQARQG
jgi:hypothetical protein